MGRVGRSPILAGCAFLIAASTPAWAQSMYERATKASADVERGQNEFRQYCAGCHGLDGRGGGPPADAKAIAPADLTRLAARNKGDFPSAKIADVIRNGGGVLGHGPNSMPAWGIHFSEKRHPEVARARIKALVRYIESLQEK